MAEAGIASVPVAVRAVVEKLLREVRHPPTQLEDLFGPLKIKSCVADPELLPLGELRKIEGGFAIHFQNGQTLGRERFTIAHELGHAFFESTGARAPRSGDELEAICDMFAAEILMPHREFVKCLSPSSPITDIVGAAATFQCSILATFRRFAEVHRGNLFVLDSGRMQWGIGQIRPSTIHRLDYGLESVLSMILDPRTSTGSIKMELGVGQSRRAGMLEWFRPTSSKATYCLHR